MSKLLYVIIIVGFFSSCRAKKPQIVDERNLISESELILLSQNCNYVSQLLQNRLELYKSKEKLYDFKTVSVWKHTNCFSNFSLKQFKQFFGEPNESIIMANRQIYHYNFRNNNEYHSQCTVEIVNDSIIKNYCLDNVKITKIGVQ